MNELPPLGTRVSIVIPEWIPTRDIRSFIGRVSEHGTGALKGTFRINTRADFFHPDFVTVTEAPSHRGLSQAEQFLEARGTLTTDPLALDEIPVPRSASTHENRGTR